MEAKKRKKIFGIIYFISAFLVLWLERKALINSTEWGERVLEFTFFICMSIEISALIYLLLYNGKKNEYLSGYVIIFVFQTIAMLPLYTQNFMYGDDLWGFAKSYNGELDNGLYYSRPFIGFLKGFLFDTSFDSIRFFRLFNACILFLFGCICFRFIYEYSRRKVVSLIYSVLVISGCFAVDCIAYASVYPISMSLLASAISIMLYVKAKENSGKNSIVLKIASVICLFNAFCMYQIGTTVVFALYMIYEKYKLKSDKGRFLDALVYLVYYGLTAIIYLILTKFFQFICGVNAGQSSRGQFISTMEQVKEKIIWFFSEILLQTLNRIIGIFFGNILFDQNNMFYTVTYIERLVGLLVISVITFIILFSVFETGRSIGSKIYWVIGLFAIPLSVWTLLILPESVYLSYYALGIILLLLWYFLDGLLIIVDYLVSKIAFISYKTARIIPLAIIFIVSLQSNYYAENAWVNFCRDSYEFLANSIAAGLNNSSNIDTISVEGNIGPYVGGREYVIFCVKDILNELGYNSEEFSILQNDSEYYISIFNDDEASKMEEIIGKDDMNRLLQFYIHDEMYGRWLYNGQAKEQGELNFLKKCFLATGQLAEKNDKTLSISLKGFNLRNGF